MALQALSLFSFHHSLPLLLDLYCHSLFLLQQLKELFVCACSKMLYLDLMN